MLDRPCWDKFQLVRVYDLLKVASILLMTFMSTIMMDIYWAAVFLWYLWFGY